MSDGDSALPLFRRDGTPIRRVEEWGALLSDPDYKIVAQRMVGAWRVSTVWLGLDHNLGDGPRHIFETMVFGPDQDILYCHRYATETAAQEGHARLVAFLVAGGVPDAYDA